MFHQLLVTWFEFVQNWGYLGIFLLMALESSIVPIPSEVVMPPAAYWASQGKMDFTLVVLAGTLGSLFGSVVNYLLAKVLGLAFLKRYGKYILISEDKLNMASSWVKDFGVPGIFAARLLPVIRHLISIPAGILKMDFLKFCVATTVGAGIWCTVLSWFGMQVLGDSPDLLTNPEALIHACKQKLSWFIVAVIGFIFAYGVLVYFKRTKAKQKSM